MGFGEENIPLISSPPPLSSNFKTFANIFISIVGAGCLGLPYTFKKTGWIMGMLMLFSVAFLTYHCMMLLVHTRRRLESIVGFPKINSFGDLGYATSGHFGKICIDVMILLSQCGFCVSYLIFISSTLIHLSNHNTNSTTSSFFGFTPKVLFIWACFPFQLGLNAIPTLTLLAPLSIFADVVDIGAMGVVIVEDIFVFLENRPPLKTFGGLSVFLYGIGVAVYAFEGFAALSYFAFGEETQGIITTNLGHGMLSALVVVGFGGNFGGTFDELGWRCLIWDGAIVVFGIVIAVSGTWSCLMDIFSPKA
ncbi:hypothetical protein TSUD_186240 [Trifolium subterraneum]|uniref:Amino acid transporter transmembrane domain-containing protein n=1 Tax=Trifolium subterraneum TaxID=3900 RepID=A0A2Z6PK67_TRISU|nr:hypothetical protein TSUD_186240 [Trifolium subterraneum]